MEHRGSIGGWLRITLLVLLALLGIVAVLIGYVRANPNALKPVASFVTERFLGRTLIIDGDVTLELSLEPRISIRDARFSNAAWSTHPDMVRVDYLLVQIDLPELLNRRVRLLDLDVRSAELFLEDPVGSAPNWSFSDTPGAEARPAADSAGSNGPGWSFILEGLGVENSTLRLELGELEPIEVEIPRLVESTDPAGYLTLDGEGRLNDQRWQVKGRLGTFDELLTAGHVDMQLDLTIHDVALSVSGNIGNLSQLAPLDLTLDLHGPDGALFGRLFRMPEAFTGDVALTAEIHPSGELHRVAIKGHISQFAVDADVTVRDLLGLDGWDGALDVRGPDAGVFAKALQITSLPGGPFEVRGAAHRYGGELELKDVTARLSGVDLTLSAAFPGFPDPKGARIDATLTGDDLRHYQAFLRLPGLPDNLPFRAELKVAANADTADALTASITIGAHRLGATGLIGTYPTFDGTRVALEAAGTDVGELARFAGQSIPLTGPYQVETVLTLAGGGLTAAGTRLEIAPVKLTGTLRIPDLKQPRRLSLDGSLDAADLGPLARLLERDDLPEGSLSMTVKAASDGSRWQLEQASGRLVRLDFSVSGGLGTLTGPTGIDLEARVRGPDINALFDHAIPDAQEIPFSLTSRIRGAEGALDIQDFELNTEGGALRLDSRIAFAKDGVGSRVSLSGAGQNLSHLIPEFSQYQPSTLPWKVEGTVSIPSAGHLEITDGRAQVGSVQLDASGVVDVSDQQQTQLSLAIRGNAISDIGRFGGLDWPEFPFSLDTELDGTSNAIDVTRLDVHWADSDLLATGSIDLTARPHVVLKGSSTLLRIAEIQQAMPEPAEAESDTRRRRLIPDTPIPLEVLARQDLDLTIDVARFEGKRLKLTDVDLSVAIADGVLALKRLQYRDEQGFFDATGNLGPAAEPGVAELTVNVIGKDADLGVFVSPDQPRETRPTYSLDIAAHGSGATIAELAGSLDGSILISSEGGRISNSIVQTYAGDFLVNVLETLNPFTKSEPFTQVQCLVLNAGIDQGKVMMQPGFVMRTANLNMFVVGDVNLKDERLNLSLATQARQGIGISAATITNPYFKIGGTLAAPALQLDAQSAAVAASVTAATAGLSIVVRGVWSRLRGEQNPCPQFLSYERKPK